ncbi:MAG: methyltransferase family protein [Candidatus Thorarchaeota archaeon]
MIEWLNVSSLVVSTILFTFFYIKSVGPATLEQKIGERAWEVCARYRLAMGVFEFLTIVNYVLYYFYPLPLPLPNQLPWDWWLSLVFAVLIGVPSVYLMVRGMMDAGEETLKPRKEHEMYGGIYERMRHPQAVGESVVWFPFALLLHSTFLVLYSFIFIPIMYIFCIYEERDLLIRFGKSYEEYRQAIGFFGRKKP